MLENVEGVPKHDYYVNGIDENRKISKELINVEEGILFSLEQEQNLGKVRPLVRQE